MAPKARCGCRLILPPPNTTMIITTATYNRPSSPSPLFILVLFLFSNTIMMMMLAMHGAMAAPSSAPPLTASPWKINKDTIELLNNGLKALVSIRQILTTIQTFNELSQMLLKQPVAGNGAEQQPQQQRPPRPFSTPVSPPPSLWPINFVQKLFFGKMLPGLGFPFPLSNHNKIAGSFLANNQQQQQQHLNVGHHQPLPSPLAMLLAMNKNAKLTPTPPAQRDPSIGLIKIGEKPPPGLFPETLPYSVSHLDQDLGFNPLGIAMDNNSSSSSSSNRGATSGRAAIVPSSRQLHRLLLLQPGEDFLVDDDPPSSPVLLVDPLYYRLLVELAAAAASASSNTIA